MIEVAKSSLDFDLGTKSATYARHGVREYWVVNAETLVTTVHRGPAADGYADRQAGPDERLVPLLVPGMTIRLADLRLE